MNVTRPDRRIVTFYSFKGGVGRSMALANVAFRLADRNALDVIVVDWDLEAPGLHRFFGISDEVAATGGGLLEYLLAWREAVEDDADAPPDATKWLIRVTDPKPANGSVSLLLAGRLDEGYSDRLRGFDWLPFYRFNAGGAAIETLRKQLSGQADMVLVDSRTGVTDAGGICTVQMPDGVVLLTAANEQSFKGIERVARAIVAGDREREGRERPKVWVAVGRAPYLEVPKHAEDWFNEYGSRFEEGYKEGLWAQDDHPSGLRSHRLPHVPRWGFGEQIIDTRLEDEDLLAMAYGTMGDEIVQWAMGKGKQDGTQDEGRGRTIAELGRDIDDAEKRGDVARLAGALFELANAFSEASDLASAAEVLQKAAGIQLGSRRHRSYAATLVLLAQIRVKQRRFDEAERLHKRAIEAAPGLSLVFSSYASFLMDVRRDSAQAEEQFRRAIDADPANVAALGNYANLLAGVRNGIFFSGTRTDPDRAEELYRRAIGQSNDRQIYVSNLENYANFLYYVRKDPDRAEELYRRAVETNPQSAIALGNYAFFLSDVRKDFDAAEELYKRAIDADPQHANNFGNYAAFLSKVRKNLGDAEELYKRAIDADPQHAGNLGSYAHFLNYSRKNFAKAEEFYKRAIDVDPKHPNNLGNYALFLFDARKDLDNAEEIYRRAIDADPKHASNLGNYAVFLWRARRDPAQAEELYKRAIDADPEHAGNLGNYAVFLKNVRKDLDKADHFYKRAIDANPKNADNLGNYAGMLLANGRQTEGISMLDRALDAPDASLAQRVECWFYALAHRPPERRSEAVAQLKRLITVEGARSPRWDLSANVERARSDGHPDVTWLALLADVISEDVAPACLDTWPAWAAA